MFQSQADSVVQSFYFRLYILHTDWLAARTLIYASRVVSCTRKLKAYCSFGRDACPDRPKDGSPRAVPRHMPQLPSHGLFTSEKKARQSLVPFQEANAFGNTYG